jgi:plastocyanin
MKGFLLHGAIVAMALLGASAPGQEVRVNVNGELVTFPNVQPGLVRNRVMVPLRFVMEHLGADVRWDNEAKVVSARRAGNEMTLGIGAPHATVNQRIVGVDVPAMIVRGRTLVPLRLMSESLGAYALWDADRRTVVITTRPESPFGPVGGEGVALVRLSMRGMRFDPDVIRVRRGQQVEVTLLNEGPGEHSVVWLLPGGAVRPQAPLGPGQQATLVFPAPRVAGRYEFYCPVGDHRERGMRGTLVVE